MEYEAGIRSEEVSPIVIPTYTGTSDKNKTKGRFLENITKKMKKKNLAEKKEKSTEIKTKLLRQTPDILPFLQIHEDHIVMKKGVMDIFQVTSKDLHSLNEEDMNFVLGVRIRFLRSYADSIKEITLNFPSNTEKQREYWLKKRSKTKDPVRLQFIDRKLFEFEFLERERSNREFFMFLYADSKDQLEDKKAEAIRNMQQAFPLIKLTKEKKTNILFLLNNQNTKL